MGGIGAGAAGGWPSYQDMSAAIGHQGTGLNSGSVTDSGSPVGAGPGLLQGDPGHWYQMQRIFAGGDQGSMGGVGAGVGGGGGNGGGD